MPVTFILGRAGAGKTRHCLDALLAELDQPDESHRLVLLVPEQASFQMERTLASRAARHGYWRAEVLSFSRLALRVLEQVGRPPETLRPSARALALRGVAGRDGETLRVFGASARTVGFFAQLDRLIERMLSENVSPDELAAAAKRLEHTGAQRRVRALAGVYRDYLEWLGPERIDPAQRLAVLRERLAGATWLHDASVWVDGFAGFTGQELETLVALARTARNVEITLLLDPSAPAVRDPHQLPDGLNLFHRTETTYQRLLKRLVDEGVEVRRPLVLRPGVSPRFAQAAELARLEAGWAVPVGVGDSSAGGVSGTRRSRAVAHRAGSDRPARSVEPVRLVQCETHRDELRAAARFIRRQVAESSGAVRFRDFAVIARDLEPFAGEVADVFAEYEIPCFLDRRRSLGSHALARFVQALLEALECDLSTAAMTRLLRCGLLPLSREQAETLENLVVANEIRGLKIWRRQRWVFERNGRSAARGAAAGHAEASAGSSSDALDAARLQVVDALGPLVQLAAAGAGRRAAEWAGALHETLVALRVPVRIAAWVEEARREQDWETAEVHRLAWDALCGVLEDLHEVLGERSLELTELAGIVGSTLSELTVGLAPPTLDQVLVSSIERSRHPDISYAWVFAFNEGVFPARPADDVLLSTADREALVEAGLPAPRVHRDDAFGERLLAYIALTRPSEGLTISYATVGDDGEPRFASPFVSELRRVLPRLEIEQAGEDQVPVCLREFARGYLRARAAVSRETTLRRRYEALRGALERSTQRREEVLHLLRGLDYRNAPAAVRAYRQPADSDGGIAWDGSPSELETYLQCPFKHFAQYGLSLSAQRGPAPLALELGSQAHEVLADVTRRAIAGSENVRDLSDAQWLRMLDDVLDAVARRQPPDLPACRPQAAFLGSVLRLALKELVLAHAERWRRGVCEPIGCELRFDASGEEGTLGALELRTAAGARVRLHGFVDRLDRCAHAGRVYLLVYDYKSSPGKVKGEYLAQDRLQLFTYLLAVEQALCADQEAQVGGVLLAPLYARVSAAAGGDFDELPPAEQRMHLLRPRGLFDAALARLLDRDLGETNSPVAAMRLKKDGGFYAWSDARPREELTARLDLARRTVLHVAEGIVAGRIDVAPLLEHRTLACQRCDFQPVCRFEPVFNRPRVAERSLPVLRQSEASDSGGSA